MLRVADCFSGVGFWIMALNQLGIEFKHQFCVEFDKYPYASYKAIHGDIKNYGDVTQIQGHEVEDIDLFFYSPPCQAFSVAGKGLGVEEHRGVLFFDSLRIIQHKQPRIAIMENVKGLTNKPHAETLRSMLACLTMAGYTNYLKVLNTKDYGIPQNRERVFIVSIRNDIDTGFDWPEPFDNGLRLKHLLESEVDEKYYISDEKCAKLIQQLKEIPKNSFYSIGNTNPSGKGMNGNVFAGGISPTVTTNKGEGHKMVVPCLTPDRVEKRQNGRRFKEDGDPSFTLTSQDKHGILVEEPKIIEDFFQNREPRIFDDCPTLRSGRSGLMVTEPNECNRLGNIYGEQFGTGYAGNVWDTDGISPALMTMQGGGRQPHIVTQHRIRKLTPKECWRLQGATDEDFEKAASVNSNSQLYKQAGNGLSVNVVTQILKQLQAKSYI